MRKLFYPNILESLWDYLDKGQVFARALDTPGHSRISQGIVGTTWTWDRGVVRAWDIPGYPRMSQDVPGYSWDYLDLGQVVARAWDIPGCPRVFLGLLRPGKEALPELGTFQDISG